MKISPFWNLALLAVINTILIFTLSYGLIYVFYIVIKEAKQNGGMKSMIEEVWHGTNAISNNKTP